MTRPRMVVSGATGLTGNAVAHALANEEVVELVACVSPSAAAQPRRPLPEGPERRAALTQVEADADVVVDFAVAGGFAERAETCLKRGWHMLVGTTGIDRSELEAFGERFTDAGLGLLYAPNFSLGAVLAMAMAEELAARFPTIEVIEYHRAGKLDAPSGTASLTAERLSRVRADNPAAVRPSGEAAARGQDIDGVRVHSLRLEGAVAHQVVVAGGPGEMLTLRHDAIDRSCYASGVLLAAQGIATHPGLTIGLENLL